VVVIRPHPNHRAKGLQWSHFLPESRLIQPDFGVNIGGTGGIRTLGKGVSLYNGLAILKWVLRR
jgi:hypothetical protein